MAQKEKVVQGAQCVCKFGTTPDKLMVLTHTKWYVNDKDASEKLVATNKDIGVPFENKTFGSCAQMRNNPCQVNVTEWEGYYENEFYDPPGGYILLDDCKATCPIGGKGCISIIDSGQKGEPSEKNMKNSDPELMSQVNPLVDMNKLEEIDWEQSNIVIVKS